MQEEHGGDVQESLQLAKRGTRFLGVNMLSELDHPEEYYINATQRVLYFIPPSDAAGLKREAVLSVATTALNITAVRWLRLSGLIIAHTIANGVEASGAQHLTIENCNIFGVGQHGLNLQNVFDVQVVDSTVHSTGCRGITVTSGKSVSLERGNSSFRNNVIHHVAQWKRTYQAGIEWQTTGCEFLNNTIAVSPHNCVDGAGVDNKWIGNTLDLCAFESSDAGAFYAGGEGGTALFNGRGTILANNRFSRIRNCGWECLNDHDIVSVQAVYMDDLLSGWQILNNSFIDCQVAMFVGGGRDNVLRDNKCQEGVDTCVLYC